MDLPERHTQHTLLPMHRVDSIAGHLLFTLTALIAIGSPWLYGAWETWWFWPFVVCIFTTSGCFAIRLILSIRLGAQRLGTSRLVASLVMAWLPFLIYALIRVLQSEVILDAERSGLLFITPVLLVAIVFIGLPEPRQRILTAIILVNLAAIGSYGIANHYLTGNSHVLWAPSYPQYQLGYHRATGPYFCPDHFSGLMEIALSMALGLFLVRSSSFRLRLGGAVLAGIAVWGIILSRSRGGGIVAGILLPAALFLCTQSWAQPWRWRARAIGMAVLTLGLSGFILFGGHYVKRFKEYPWTKLEHSDRYQMSAAAIRAWQSAPWLGVGPGMHRNLWPHFAPSSDGDRLTGRWPTHINNQFHSFEAHDDWAQFLEEYGVIGLGLFLAALGMTIGAIYLRWRRWAFVQSGNGPAPSAGEWILPGILLAALAMAVHSIGDFNLQIPATVWQLGLLTGIALATADRTLPARRQGSTA